MSLYEFASVLLAAALVNHLVLVQLLGVSAFFAGSQNLRQAGEFGLMLLLVMPLSVALALAISRFILTPLDLEVLLLITAVSCSALFSTMLLRLARRHYPLSARRNSQALLLLSGNSGIIGFVLLSHDADLSYAALLVSALGAALGFALLLLAFAALRQRLHTAQTPAPFRGPALSLLSAGLVAMSLMGLAGLA